MKLNYDELGKCWMNMVLLVMKYRNAAQDTARSFL